MAHRAPAARRAHAGAGETGRHRAESGRLLDAGPAIAKPRPRSQPLPPPRPSLALAALALIALALALYWSGLRYPLVFDDLNLNAYALRTHYTSALERIGGIRWFSDATFGAVYALGGGYFWQRLVNVLLHGATAALLFGFLARLFCAVLADERARALAFFGALWFAVNPVAVYGVAYLIQRSIVLATLFSLLSLVCFLEGLLRGSRRWYVAAVVAYVLAVSSKEHAVMLPAVALALAVLVRGRSRELAWSFGAFALIGAAIAAQRFSYLGTVYEPFAAYYLADLRLAYPLSVENQATLFFRYLGTWLVPWPGWMSIDLRVPFPRSLLAWPETPGLLAWLAYGVAAGWLLLRRGRIGLAGFGLLYPWLFALTEFSVARLQEPLVLYRSYLWMGGLPAILPALIPRPLPRWGYGALGALCVALAAGAHERIGSMASPHAVWDDAVRKNADPGLPGSERAYVSRGGASLDLSHYEAALADFERAIEINPRSPEAYSGRGSYRWHMRQFDAALADFDRALTLDPAYPQGYYKRCALKASLKRFTEALADCEKTVSIVPGDEGAWVHRGVVLRGLGRRQDAVASFAKALGINPTSGFANHSYGLLLIEEGRRDAVVKEHFAIACREKLRDACRILKDL